MKSATLPTDYQVRALLAETTTCAGVLPYWPVWAAAQFASDDTAKQLLNFVHVYRDGDVLQIESTDGHRAFRYRFPGGPDALWQVPDQGLLLQAKPLKKAVPYTRLLTISHDMRATFHGGKGVTLTELSSVNLAGFYSVNYAVDCGKVGTYLNINQLWPGTFTYAPGRAFAFNARYLRDWCAVVEKLSTNNVTRCECNAPTTPFCWSADFEPGLGQHFDNPKVEYLLMPVHVRV